MSEVTRILDAIKLHDFAGLTIDRAAVVLGVSVRKAYNVWAYARAWLFRCLEARPHPEFEQRF